MNKVFVVDNNRQPLAPCSPRRAKRLLTTGKAAVLRPFPFTIILKHVITNVEIPPLRLKLAPGITQTAITIVNQDNGEIVWRVEIEHRSEQIKKLLAKPALSRHSKHYFQSSFNKRKRVVGQLSSSRESHVANIIKWATHLPRYCPIITIIQELTDGEIMMINDSHATAKSHIIDQADDYESYVSEPLSPPIIKTKAVWSKHLR
jgi:uncharacterized protein (DUF2249 family)